MTKFVPETLHSRIILMLVIGVATTHLISMTIHYLDERAHARDVATKTAARHVAIAGQALESVPPSMRAALAQDLATPWLSISLVQAGLTSDPSKGDRDLDLSPPASGSNELLTSDATNAPEDLSYQVFISDCLRNGLCESAGGGLLANIRFSDRTGAELRVRVDDPLPLLLTRLSIEFVVMVLGTLAISYFAARWVARPLRSFAGAAERLGHNIHAASLNESGATEIRRLATAFNGMQRRLRRFIDDRTQMLAAISHDLRTPITRLRLRAEFVEDGEQREKMLGDLDGMDRMIDSLLAFAREETTTEEPRPIDLAALVESVCHDAADAGADIHFSGARSGAIYGRSHALKRVFVNLIDNAVKYGDTAEVEMLSGPSALTIRICDRGPGLPEHELEEVFKPFYRADRSRMTGEAGTGLGLSIARSILRGHGGDLTLKNQNDGGLCAVAVVPTISERTGFDSRLAS